MHNKLFNPLMIALCYLMATVGSSQAAELKIVPYDLIILNPTNPIKNYYDSVSVNIEDTINRGDVLAAFGDTGDSFTVHLHFQVNTEANPFYLKGLPIFFDNLEDVNKGADPLCFVSSTSRELIE